MLWPGLVTLVGFLLAFVPLLLKQPDLPDVVVLTPILAGVAWAWGVWKTKKRKVWIIAPLVLSAAAAFHVAWMFVLASYETDDAGPVPGQPAPMVEATRVRDGAKFRLAAQRGHGVLLVFGRGHW